MTANVRKKNDIHLLLEGNIILITSLFLEKRMLSFFKTEPDAYEWIRNGNT